MKIAAALLFVSLSLAAVRAQSADGGLGPIPDVEVQDQTGRTLHFYSDLVRGRAFALNFIFTTCSTTCPQLGAASAALARTLAAGGDDRLRVISISFDPGTDTPDRLREWSANFGPAPGWTLVTGTRRNIETLLRALQSYTADKNLHSANFLLGNDAAHEWRHLAGTTPPGQLAAALRELAGSAAPARPAPAAGAAGAHYFPDLPLVDQHGRTRRFYSDLVKGHVIVLTTIFTDCAAVCPIAVERLARIQTALGDRVGRDVFLLSITVDPENDTPEKLLGYAERAGARPGWEFLTGDKANVDAVLRKLGQYVETRESHSNLFIVGNEPTGLWKKAFGLAPPDQLIQLVESVADDGR